MLSHQSVADHNWAQDQVCNLLKTLELNMKLYRLDIWPKLLKDMTNPEYRAYCGMITSMLKKAC